MSKQGAALQGYNNELVMYIEEMRLKREDLETSINKETEEKRKLEEKIELLSNELKSLEERLEKKEIVRKEYNKIIKTGEDAYDKILDSSKTLLTLLKKEAVTLKQQAGQTTLDSASASAISETNTGTK